MNEKNIYSSVPRFIEPDLNAVIDLVCKKTLLEESCIDHRKIIVKGFNSTCEALDQLFGTCDYKKPVGIGKFTKFKGQPDSRMIAIIVKSEERIDGVSQYQHKCYSSDLCFIAESLDDELRSLRGDFIGTITIGVNALIDWKERCYLEKRLSVAFARMVKYYFLEAWFRHEDSDLLEKTTGFDKDLNNYELDLNSLSFIIAYKTYLKKQFLDLDYSFSSYKKLTNMLSKKESSPETE